jgi:hypothetical protein
MKIKLIFILLVSFTCLFIGCENEAAPTESIAAIEDDGDLEKGRFHKNWLEGNLALEEKFGVGIMNKDVDLFANCFWNDPNFCFVTATGEVVRGYEANREGIVQLFETFETIEVEVHWIDRWLVGRKVYAVGEASFRMVMYDGTVVEYKEVWTDGRMKVKGEWVIFLNHAHMLVE